MGEVPTPKDVVDKIVSSISAEAIKKLYPTFGLYPMEHTVFTIDPSRTSLVFSEHPLGPPTSEIELVTRTRISIREKTEDEIRSERIDAILDRNSAVGKCITCGEDIKGNEPLYDTIHGKYHAAPRTCVEGR